MIYPYNVVNFPTLLSPEEIKEILLSNDEVLDYAEIDGYLYDSLNHAAEARTDSEELAAILREVFPDLVVIVDKPAKPQRNNKRRCR